MRDEKSGPWAAFRQPGWNAALALICVTGLIVALVRVFLGYGYDDDTYRMLQTWQTIVSHHSYATTRFQGNIVAEFMLGFTAWVGGSIFSNLTVLVCSLVSIFFTCRIARILDIEDPLPVVALCASNGYFLIASSTSMDYMIAYCFFTAGLYFYLKNALLPACMLFALAAGARLPYFAITVVTLFGWQMARGRHAWRDYAATMQFCLFLFFVSGLMYLPIWISHGLRFDWLDAATVEGQGIAGFIARFLYKTFYLFGPAGSVAAAIILAMRLSGRSGEDAHPFRKPAVILAASIILVNLAIFARVPVEISYLIPIIPFVGIGLMGIGCRGAIWALILGNILANCVNLEMLDITYRSAGPCAETYAEGARIRPHLEAGLLVREFRDVAGQDRCYRTGILLYPYEDKWNPLPVSPPDGQPH